MTLTIKKLEIPFKQAFSHATATRSCTESVLVVAESSKGVIGVGEGCPRKYVTGETLQTAKSFFDSHRQVWEQFNGLESLKAWMSMNSEHIDTNPASWCAVELALLDRWGQEQGQSIEAFLTLQELAGQFQYSAVLGTENVATFEKHAQQFAALDFCDFKVKVSGNVENDSQRIEFLQHLPLTKGLSINTLTISHPIFGPSLNAPQSRKPQHSPGYVSAFPQSFRPNLAQILARDCEGYLLTGPYLRIRLDANNFWGTAAEAVAYLNKLHYPFMAIEEPLHVGDYEGCRRISQALGVPIILDESFLRIEQFTHLQADPKTWMINIRISKMGGILRSLAIAEQAKALGIPIIIGAQVGETSILTRAALTVANQYHDILLAQEGAFGTYLLEHDITDAPLIFGKGGRLDAQSISGRPGLGVAFTKDTSFFL